MKRLSRWLPLVLMILLFLFIQVCKEKPEPPLPPEPPIEYVDIEICKESKLLPNKPWCPITEIEKFEEGKQPVEICQIHTKPEEPEKPEPSPPWIGTSCYQAIDFKLEDVLLFLDEVSKAGGNATEFFLCFSWQDGYKNSPYLIINPNYDDGGIQVSLVDLDKWSDPILTKWEAIFAKCAVNRIVPFIRIQDFVSLKATESKHRYCFRANKQRILDGTLTGGIWGDPIKSYYSFLNTKLIETLKKVGIEKYFIVPMNEADYVADPSDTEELKDSKVFDFHDWYIKDLESKGCPKSQIIISTGRAFAKLKTLNCWMEIHGCNSDTTLLSQIATYGTEIFSNGDGLDPYAKGQEGDSPTKREPSLEQAFNIGKIIKEKNLFGYCFFNRFIEFGPPDIKRAQFNVLKEIKRGINE